MNLDSPVWTFVLLTPSAVVAARVVLWVLPRRINALRRYLTALVIVAGLYLLSVLLLHGSPMAVLFAAIVGTVLAFEWVVEDLLGKGVAFVFKSLWSLWER